MGSIARRMTRYAAIAAAALVVAVALVAGIGFLLPRDHQASVTLDVPVSLDSVWALITHIEGFPEWRPDVERVERQPDRDGRPAWHEIGSGGTLPLYVRSSDPPRELVVAIDDGLPFGGTWTYRLTADGGSTRVAIVEDGQVYNPIFRFVGRFIIGYDATLERYRDALLAVTN